MIEDGIDPLESDPRPCWNCCGRGVVAFRDGDKLRTVTCPECRGTGDDPGDKR